MDSLRIDDDDMDADRLVQVRWRSERFEFRVRTMEELRESLRQATGGARHLKLILKGRVVTTIEDIDGVLLAIGTNENEADDKAKFEAERIKLRDRDVVDDLGAISSSAEVGDEPLSDEISGVRTGFGRIEVLEEFSDSDKAVKMLKRLATDPGVRYAMRQRRWFVPVLCEMYPDGKVGVDPVCVLGLNENKGQRIKLRLRTDDLRGFRKSLSVFKVLYHELAHNARSEHDGIFYALVSAIEKQAMSTEAQGRRLGGASVLPATTTRTKPQSNASPRRLGGGALTLQQARAHVVGAFASPSFTFSGSCGCLGDDEDCGVEECKSSPPPCADEEGQQEPLPPAPVVENDPVAQKKRLPSPPEEEEDSMVDPNSPEAAILSASRELGKIDPDARAEAATTLQIILTNAESKSRIRLANKRFQRTVGKFGAALRLLEACGFQKERDQNEDVLVFRRHDPGLLWLGRSALTEITAAA